MRYTNQQYRFGPGSRPVLPSSVRRTLCEHDHRIGRRLLAAGLTLLGALGSGCSDEQTPTAPVQPPVHQAPQPGWIVVAAAVSGEDSPEGFDVGVEGGSTLTVAAGESVTIPDLTPGFHTVHIKGIAANCVLHGPDAQYVEVFEARGSSIVFNLTCINRSKGGIRVRNIARGFDYFSAAIDDGPWVMAQGGEVLFDGLDQGDHAIRLSVNTGGCQLDGPNPPVANVTAGRITEAYFMVLCQGSLVVSVTTTGTNQPTGYTVYAVKTDEYYCDDGGCANGIVSATGSILFEGLPIGEYNVGLEGVPANCAATPGTQTVEVLLNVARRADIAVRCH